MIRSEPRPSGRGLLEETHLPVGALGCQPGAVELPAFSRDRRRRMPPKTLWPRLLICVALAAAAAGQTPKAGEVCEFYSPADNPPLDLKAMPCVPVFVTPPA